MTTVMSEQNQVENPHTHVDALKDELSEARHRLNDFVAYGIGGLPVRKESMLFHEVSCMVRRPPFTRTSRRKNVLKSVDFPEGCEYDEAVVDRPLRVIPEALRQQTHSFGFNALEMTPSQMLAHWFIMFQEYDLLSKYKIHGETLRDYFLTVHNAYRTNTYHNFNHAMDVAQFAFALFANSEQLRTKLSSLDILCCLVLGLAHDMDHPGVNNAFLVKTRDPVAMLYNDQSVLENAHAASLFLMFHNKPTCNVLANVEGDEYSQARKTILRGILATDMARHFALVKEISAHQSLTEVEEVPDDVRMSLIDCIAKSGDICHLVRPWPVAKAWEDLVMEEFFEQGDYEKQLGMTPDGLFDREKCKVANSQCWFYDNMGKPLFKALEHHVPTTAATLLDVMQANVSKWKEMC
ncbi:cAMP-dependent 3',5'-cyclic phosphodiesterase 4B [Salpingoeca rosetta]|uniref:cAMP-dependent 3',5'-cyclic phosphodiesterase 4B n=1 Tax=Salpingoeca rosetta (strain ATCC 50818 / BSB-021) TaxID=946362 RepID=F2UNV2_SALR5|nr:cAMP-dependent 3',5'-cyclic phosphodiesterase 4B [Salpingoeca rosetta]XP_012493097.1 cAMP-dependent 3',5'-cyclic phosphodiesterase 4B, variant 2 [Salpingoeca rosetta]XP_012493098.1 cAMP-dependent 3',5'-cyclic phosphodiesterase 4B, variant 1 [Salpingoeca rosetta]EGD79307.1 cAMP-dependent 3',5'-cyclic phosphodiesterase 4B, variant 2 [Salpingoeca rosetta]EGD79308.1 cAMP-dependent 3',5'-cyclic phosphodiesterase 4B, variant 1 [Salpingoeca rosetta]EGD79309.1 cAMP-dependent 3',5'-cyclic phosphodie|eukprot:XP_004989078.1 cAMP-dependent 3',5'-cyclic phosphodiesterase 4B [Salpingoeca rosetta]